MILNHKAAIELLRDLYVWAYERSTQEYLTIKQDLAEPDPLRLTYRDVIKQTIHAVVTCLDQDPIKIIRQELGEGVTDEDRDNVEALVIEELRRLHEGVLARYKLRPSEFLQWKTSQGI